MGIGLQSERALPLPRRSSIVLCGPAGAGKSTFVAEIVRANGLPATARGQHELGIGRRAADRDSSGLRF